MNPPEDPLRRPSPLELTQDELPVKFRSIASLLIGRIVTLALVLMVLSGLVNAWMELRHNQQEFQQRMTFVADNSLRLLASALWDIEQARVREQVQWLSGLKEVGYVRVRVQMTGETFEAGQKLPHGDAPSLTLPILPPSHATTSAREIGQLELWSDRDHYWALVRDSTLRVVLGYIGFTVLICLVVNWVMRQELRRPLRQIAHFAASLKPQELGRPLELERPHRDRLDEIDLVIRGFQQLQHDLRHYIEHLDTLVAERTGQLEGLVEEVRRMSLMDALTGCYNRRAIEERLPSDIQHCRRHERPLAVIFTDVDHFKRINDVYGHSAGDEVLREVAQRCLRTVRSNTDWMARYGGEEFLIVLPNCDIQGAHQLADRLQEAVSSSPVMVEGGVLDVTASFGVAQMHVQEPWERLLARADEALYVAKGQGRNCVRLAPAPPMLAS